MSITPPSKVNINCNSKEIQILASGVDTLILSVYLEWEDTEIFQYFNSLKEAARILNANSLGEIKKDNTFDRWPFEMKPHGSKGYAWILLGKDYALRVGNWTERSFSPNIMVEIRSETLWRLGVSEAVSQIINVIENMRAVITDVNLSRVDLCVDVMMPESLWGIHLLDYVVTRATDMVPHYKYRKLTGITIGKGVILLRMYDKPFEIKQSKKEWMFDIWGIKGAPESKKVIRFEFQLRREFLKEVGLNTIEHLKTKDVNAWAYCTEKWLKFQDRPGKHHNQKRTFAWWKKIQKGYRNYQGASPLVREKAFQVDKRQISQQIKGHLSSFIAMKREEKGIHPDKKESFSDCILEYMNEVKLQDKYIDADLQKRISKKRPRFHRTDQRRLGYGKATNQEVSKVFHLRKEDEGKENDRS